MNPEVAEHTMERYAVPHAALVVELVGYGIMRVGEGGSLGLLDLACFPP